MTASKEQTVGCAAAILILMELIYGAEVPFTSTVNMWLHKVRILFRIHSPLSLSYGVYHLQWCKGGEKIGIFGK